MPLNYTIDPNLDLNNLRRGKDRESAQLPLDVNSQLFSPSYLDLNNLRNSPKPSTLIEVSKPTSNVLLEDPSGVSSYEKDKLIGEYEKHLLPYEGLSPTGGLNRILEDVDYVLPEWLKAPIGVSEGLLRGLYGFAYTGTVTTGTLFYHLIAGKGPLQDRLDTTEDMYRHISTELMTKGLGKALFMPVMEYGKKTLDWVGEAFTWVDEQGSAAADFAYNEKIKAGVPASGAAAEAALVRTSYMASALVLPWLGVKSAQTVFKDIKGAGPIDPKDTVPVPPPSGPKGKPTQLALPKPKDVPTNRAPYSTWTTPAYDMEYVNGLKLDTVKEIRDWAINQAGSRDFNLYKTRIPNTEFNLPEVEPRLDTTIPTAATETFTPIPTRGYSPPMELQPQGIQMSDGVSIPYTHDILPYEMFRAIYNKNKQGKPVKNEATIMSRYTEYVNGFLPDNALAKNFNDAVVRGFRLFEAKQVAEKLKGSRIQKFDVRPKLLPEELSRGEVKVPPTKQKGSFTPLEGIPSKDRIPKTLTIGATLPETKKAAVAIINRLVPAVKNKENNMVFADYGEGTSRHTWAGAPNATMSLFHEYAMEKYKDMEGKKAAKHIDEVFDAHVLNSVGKLDKAIAREKSETLLGYYDPVENKFYTRREITQRLKQINPEIFSTGFKGTLITNDEVHSTPRYFLKAEDQDTMFDTKAGMAWLSSLDQYNAQFKEFQVQETKKLMQEDLAGEGRTGPTVSTKFGPMDKFSAETIGRIYKYQGGHIDPELLGIAGAKGVKSLADFVKKASKKFPKKYSDSTLALYWNLIETEKQLVGNKIALINREGNANLPPYISQEGRSMFWTAIEIMGGKAIGELWRNPYWRPLSDTIFHQEFYMGKSQSTSGAPFLTARHTELGPWATELNKIFSTYEPRWFAEVKDAVPDIIFGTGGTKIGQKPNDLLFRYLDGDVTLKEIPRKLKELGDVLRTFTNKFYNNYLQQPALKVLGTEYLPNWIPHYFEWKTIANNTDSFISMLIRNGISAGQAHEMTYHLIKSRGMLKGVAERLTDDNIKFMLQGNKLPAIRSTSIDYARQLRNIPTTELMPFLKTNVYGILEAYLESAVARGEYTKRFGPNNEIANQMIISAIKTANKDGQAVNIWEIHKAYDLLEAIQGVYKQDVRKANPTWMTLSRMGTAGLNLTLLPLTTIASFSEVVYPLHRAGISAYSKALVKTGLVNLPLGVARWIYKDFKILGVTQTKAMEMAEMIRKAGSAAAMERMTALFVGEPVKFNDYYFKANFLTYWTRAMQLFSAEVFRTMVVDHVNGLNKQKQSMLDPYYEQLFNHYGFTIPEAIRWVAEGQPTDTPIGKRILEGTHTFVEENVLMPNAANTPLWHSNPGLMTLKYLKSFPSLIGNTKMKAIIMDTYGTLHERNFAGAGRNVFYGLSMLIGSIMMADISNLVADQIRYGEKGNVPVYQSIQDETDRRIFRAIDRAGLAGAGNFLFDAFFYSYGKGIMTVLLGPAVSKTSDLITAIKSGKARPVARELAKLTPILGISKNNRTILTEFYEHFLTSLTPLKASDEMSGRESRGSRNKEINPYIMKTMFVGDSWPLEEMADDKSTVTFDNNKFKYYAPYKLSDVFKHIELEKRYPWIANMPLMFTNKHINIVGQFSPTQGNARKSVLVQFFVGDNVGNKNIAESNALNTEIQKRIVPYINGHIFVNFPALKMDAKGTNKSIKEALRGTLIHELQNVIDVIEGRVPTEKRALETERRLNFPQTYRDFNPSKEAI